MNESIYIHGYQLQLTCFACPEQYDIFDPTGKQVGYIRLRHGHLHVYYPDYGGKVVYETRKVQGDGVFAKNERLYFLTLAVEKIQLAILDDMYVSIDSGYNEL